MNSEWLSKQAHDVFGNSGNSSCVFYAKWLMFFSWPFGCRFCRMDLNSPFLYTITLVYTIVYFYGLCIYFQCPWRYSMSLCRIAYHSLHFQNGHGWFLALRNTEVKVEKSPTSVSVWVRVTNVSQLLHSSLSVCSTNIRTHTSTHTETHSSPWLQTKGWLVYHVMV